jgi:hypothetical protein
MIVPVSAWEQVLRGMFSSTSGEVTEGWRISNNEKFRNFYSSSYKNRVSNSLRRMEHAVHME